MGEKARRHPLATLLCVSAACAACMSLIPARTLAGCIVQTLAACAVTTAVIALICPKRLSPVRSGCKGKIPVFVIVGVIASAASSLACEIALGTAAMPDASSIAATVLLCAVLFALTGLFEEGLFRCIVLDAFAAGLSQRKHPLLIAAIASSLVFGAFHVAGTTPVPGDAIATAQLMLKPLQAAMFGLAMAAICIRAKSIIPAVALHALFDFVSTGCGILWQQTLAQGYVTGSISDLASIIASMAFLVPLAIWAWRAISAAEGSYEPMFNSR